jgi:hypothetical protein
MSAVSQSQVFAVSASGAAAGGLRHRRVGWGGEEEGGRREGAGEGGAGRLQDRLLRLTASVASPALSTVPAMRRTSNAP